MSSLTLFDYADKYPHVPGRKERGGTSEETAEAMKSIAPRLRERVLECLARHGARTADETSTLIGEDVLSVRPRFSELLRLGRIRKTGDRRQNRSGMGAAVWELVARR